MEMGDVIDVYPYEGVTKKGGTDEEICKFTLKTNVLFDEAGTPPPSPPRPLISLLRHTS